MSRPRRQALALGVAAAICGALSLLLKLEAVRVVTAIPLLLYLPGAAVVLAADPWSRRTRGWERLFWCAVGSITVAIAGGLALNLVASLTEQTWTAWPVAVAVIGAGVGARAGADADRSQTSLWARVRALRLHRSAALLSTGAVVLAAAAMAISIYSSSHSNRERFVQFWILPIPPGAGATAPLAEVGLTNFEGRRERFDVNIKMSGPSGNHHQVVTLAEGQTWTYHIKRHHLVPVEASVARASRPGRILDSVRLAAPAHQ